MTTINISLPTSMYLDAKKFLASRGYASISELLRDTLRDTLYPRLTENGFTPEFEEMVLESAKEPVERSIEWDGKTPFTEFVLRHASKHNGKNKIHRKIPKKSKWITGR